MSQEAVILSVEFVLDNSSILLTCFDRYDHPHILAGRDDGLSRCPTLTPVLYQ